MKELETFRKFLAEGEAKEFTFYFKKGKTGEEQAKKAKAILKSKGINFKSGGKMAIDFPASADKGKIKDILQKNGVTRYIVGTATNEGEVSENALANDRGDGTFEVTADIDILGKKFNFSDICPGAHKLISDLADEYEGRDIKLGDLLYLANLHQQFFNLEKKALGPQGIDADDLYEIKRLYVEIHNIATNAFGADVTQEIGTYMDMHMDKIKKAGLKASEPGGSSDYKADMDYYMDEEGDPDEFLEEELEENDKALDELLNEE